MSLKFDRHDNWEDSSFITLWYSLNVCNKARMTMTRLHSVRFKCVDFLLVAAIVVVFPVTNGVHRRLRTGDCAVVQWDYLVGGVFRISTDVKNTPKQYLGNSFEYLLMSQSVLIVSGGFCNKNYPLLFTE